MKVWRPKTLAEVERKLILRTLAYFNGDKKHTALALGISYTKVVLKIKQYEREKDQTSNGDSSAFGYKISTYNYEREPNPRKEYVLKTVEVQCALCGTKFEKDLLTYEFLIKYGQTVFYCSTVHEHLNKTSPSK